MTEPTRTRLARTLDPLAFTEVEHAPRGLEGAPPEIINGMMVSRRKTALHRVDKFLDELMEPGKGAFVVAREAWMEEKSPEYIFRTVIHAIREGK